MDKEAFLRLQYLRMLNAEDFVVEQWRRSVDRFLADMWERTPKSVGRRFLAPVDPKLGFSPDNVEWRFPKVHGKSANTKKSKAQSTPVKPVQARHPKKAERKQIELAAKDAKRAAIAAELAAWNNGLLVRSR